MSTTLLLSSIHFRPARFAGECVGGEGGIVRVAWRLDEGMCMAYELAAQ
jgi:hypothetical protein